MKIIVFLLLPFAAHAWELVTPGRPGDGVVAITTITDLMTVRQSNIPPELLPNPNLNPAHYVAFADEVGPGCRMLANLQPDDPDPRRATGYTYRNRYVVLEVFRGEPQAVMLPVALFARAHNLPVRVKLRIEDNACRVQWIQTCTADGNCPDPP